MNTRNLLCFAIMLGLSACASQQANAATILADSVSEFSLVQGQGNWFYGEYDYFNDGDSTYDASTDFSLITTTSPADMYGYGSPNTWVGTGFLRIGDIGAHPHGPNPAVGPDPDVRAVRRWVAEQTRLITITGDLAKLPAAGDGVLGEIYVNGAQIYSQTIAGTDTTGVSFSVQTSVTIGDNVDFVLSDGGPTQSVNNDSASFSALIVPEPTTASILAMGCFLPLLSRRRNFFV